MQLLHDYVAIEVDHPPEKTEGGLYLHRQIKTYPPTGTVRHVAANISDIKVGDRVVYKVYASIDIDVEDGLAIVPYDGVIATL
jgi:co-chaperonin GroES (HSP10)